MKIDVKFSDSSKEFKANFGEVMVVGQDPGAVEKAYADGQKAEYDRFWDAYQNNGERASYQNAFYSSFWNDTSYNPKYPIVTNTANTAAQDMMASSRFSDTLVDITINAKKSSYVFSYNTTLTTIRKLTVAEDSIFTGWFDGCTKLANITMAGTIANNFTISACPLTVASMKSIISCLKNFAGTENANTRTVKFSTNCWNALEADSAAPDGGTWQGYVTDTLCWNI